VEDTYKYRIYLTTLSVIHTMWRAIVG